ncbi:hypothetical protein T4B_5893 [Trichinella pseudospiralis]|uniref:Uncharacterized protein n=1 Tax=Trichinella pseudospiralis TaxID=6337 RepID=A0A0V1J990_TRIPS|nr:hypothetical protein T4B_5893 [Trichinella pseudospiralis]
MTIVACHTFLEMVIEFSWQLAQPYLPPVLSSCFSYIFLIYSIFSQTDQSLSVISWQRVLCLIYNLPYLCKFSTFLCKMS